MPVRSFFHHRFSIREIYGTVTVHRTLGPLWVPAIQYRYMWVSRAI